MTALRPQSISRRPKARNIVIDSKSFENGEVVRAEVT